MSNPVDRQKELTKKRVNVFRESGKSKKIKLDQNQGSHECKLKSLLKSA